MSGWVSRWRTLMVGASCLLHLGLIAGVLLAEQWIFSAHASRPPVLPIELVTPADSPPPEPPPMKAEPPKPKPVPPRPLRLPKPIETPLPQISETASEPPPPAEARPEPPAPAAPAPTAPAPAVTAARPSIPADSDPGRAGPAVSAPVQSTAPPGATDGIPLGRPAPSAPAGPAVASAPSRDSGSTGKITQLARPQGGYQVRPGYPQSARRLGIQGTTLLKVHVLTDGRVGDVVVQETAGHPDLDQAAADAVRRWRFDPARRGNDPVAMWVLLPVEFRLK